MDTPLTLLRVSGGQGVEYDGSTVSHETKRIDLDTSKPVPIVGHESGEAVQRVEHARVAAFDLREESGDEAMIPQATER